MKPRDTLIDFLRGISVFLMIWIHTSAYFLSNPLSRYIWDTQEWVVHAFIFCSVYLALGKANKDISWLQILKRIWRILWPYYVFLGSLVTLHLLFDKPKSEAFILQSLMLTSGTDFNWLPMLFIQLTVSVPIFLWLAQKNKAYIYITLGICLLCSIFYFWRDIKPFYRFIMLPPWFLVVLFTYAYQKFHGSWHYLIWILLALSTVSTFIFGLLQSQGIETLQYFHKYPPDLYHITIGLSGLCIAILTYKLLGKYLDFLKPIYTFLSKYSYSLFFVHVLVMNFITLYYGHWKLSWWEFLLWTLFGSLLVQLGIILVQSWSAAARLRLMR